MDARNRNCRAAEVLGRRGAGPGRPATVRRYRSTRPRPPIRLRPCNDRAVHSAIFGVATGRSVSRLSLDVRGHRYCVRAGGERSRSCAYGRTAPADQRRTKATSEPAARTRRRPRSAVDDPASTGAGCDRTSEAAMIGQPHRQRHPLARSSCARAHSASATQWKRMRLIAVPARAARGRRCQDELGDRRNGWVSPAPFGLTEEHRYRRAIAEAKHPAAHRSPQLPTTASIGAAIWSVPGQRFVGVALGSASMVARPADRRPYHCRLVVQGAIVKGAVRTLRRQLPQCAADA